MHEIIDNRVRRNEPLINGLFVPRNTEKVFTKQKSDLLPKQNVQTAQQNKTFDKPVIAYNGRQISTIFSLKEGFGFIKGENSSKNVFFFHSSLMEYDFNDLEVGDKVEYTVETKEDGKLVAKDVKVIE
jgi:cold shock CspA family protein